MYQVQKKFLLLPLILALEALTFGVVHAGESSTYDFQWLDPDKEVYVLQNRKYRKKGRPYANLGAGITTSGAFTSGQNLQGRVGFFVSEDWGGEFLISKNFFDSNDTANSVKSAGAVPFSRNIENYMAGILLWSPFYGKLNTFNEIVYFDWIIGVGISQLNEENNRKHLDAGKNLTGADTFSKESHTGFLWDTALKFYLSENFNIRLDLTALYYSARKAMKDSAGSDTSMYNHYDLTLSLGYSI